MQFILPLLIVLLHVLFQFPFLTKRMAFCLDCVPQAFYYEGKAIMSNEEFDNLKEELMWEGSSVVMLSIEQFHLII